MREVNLATLSRLSGLCFIFAALFDVAPLVVIRLGHGAHPYGTLPPLVRAAPWPLVAAVLAHIGDLEHAKRFDRLMCHRLRDHRIYGSWFGLEARHGPLFAVTARLTFAHVTGRRLRWQPMTWPASTDRRSLGVDSDLTCSKSQR